MTEATTQVEASLATVLLVDDDEGFSETARSLLESEGYAAHVVASYESALTCLSERAFDVLLISDGLVDLEKESLLVRIRAEYRDLRIVLMVSDGRLRPSRQALHRLEIQGFFEKSDGPERMLLWVDVATKARRAIDRQQQSRRALDAVLAATAGFHRRHEKGGLYREILEQSNRLVGADGAVMALFPDALGEDGDLLVEEVTGASARVVAGAGVFATVRDWTRLLAPSGLGVVRRCMANEGTCVELPWLCLPLRVGEHVLGFVAHRVLALPAIDLELLDILAHQASVAIQNALYYEMAALDPLTGVHARRIFEVWSRREVRAAVRTGSPLALLLIDMDGLKTINDQGGHRVGDTAIGLLGRVLRETTRENDLSSRLGGDEFAMLMPSTDLIGARSVAGRILELLASETVLIGGQSMSLSASVGVSSLESCGPCPASVGRALGASYFDDLVEELIRRADESLYFAKRSGRAKVGDAEVVRTSWMRNSGEGEVSRGEADQDGS